MTITIIVLFFGILLIVALLMRALGEWAYKREEKELEGSMPRSDIQCEHINFEVRGNDQIGFVYCHDCKKRIQISVAFNNLITRLRKLEDDLKKQVNP